MMEQKKEEFAKLFTKFSILMDQNTKGVQIGCYSIAFIGLTYALRKVRPFSKFRRPSDIPKRFINERRELIGVVERIEPNGTLLMVNHKPLIPIPGVKRGELPVRVAGVEVTGHGISWLQTLVAGNEVTFIPVNKQTNYVECEIKMNQFLPKSKVKSIDIGESLVLVGFAKIIERPLSNNYSDYQYYYLRLKAAEDAALKKKLGIRYYIKPTKDVLFTAGAQLNKLARVLIQRFVKQTNRTPRVALA